MTEPRPFYNISRGNEIVERLHAIERSHNVRVNSLVEVWRRQSSLTNFANHGCIFPATSIGKSGLTNGSLSTRSESSTWPDPEHQRNPRFGHSFVSCWIN